MLSLVIWYIFLLINKKTKTNNELIKVCYSLRVPTTTVVRELLKITHIQLLVCINPPLKIVPRNTQFTPIT